MRGTPVSVAIRPERLTVRLEADDPGGPNAFTGKIEERAYLGDVTLYQIALKSGLFLRASHPNAGAAGEALEPGKSVIAEFAPEAALVLDR
jgi:putrescine transport system ATP-binding protein